MCVDVKISEGRTFYFLHTISISHSKQGWFERRLRGRRGGPASEIPGWRSGRKEISLRRIGRKEISLQLASVLLLCITYASAPRGRAKGQRACQTRATGEHPGIVLRTDGKNRSAILSLSLRLESGFGLLWRESYSSTWAYHRNFTSLPHFDLEVSRTNKPSKARACARRP